MADITEVEPRNSPSLGGVELTIRGSGFKGATSVRFEDADGAKYSAESFKVVSDTELKAVTPSLPGYGSYRSYVIGADGNPSTAGTDPVANEFCVVEIQGRYNNMGYYLDVSK